MKIKYLISLLELCAIIIGACFAQCPEYIDNPVKRSALSVDPYEIKYADTVFTSKCTQYYAAKDGDNCFTIPNRFRISEKRFGELNFPLDCSDIQPGDEFCVNDGRVNCLKFAVAPSQYYNCTLIAEYFGLSVNTLKAINPGLDCDDIQLDIFCVDSLNPPCTKLYTIQINDTLEFLLKNHNLTTDEFYASNPYINASTFFPGFQICLSKQQPGNFNIQLYHEIIQSIAAIDSQVASAFSNYIEDPRENTQGILLQAFENSFENPQVRVLAKQLEQSNKALKTFYEVNNISAAHQCELYKSAEYRYDSVQECFCSNIESLLYCSSLMKKQLQANLPTIQADLDSLSDLLENLASNYTQEDSASNITKRETKAGEKKSDACAPDFDPFELCISFDCCVDIKKIISICAGAEGCVLPSEDDRDFDKDNYRINSYISIYVKACFTVIADVIGKAKLGGLIGWDGCFAKASLSVIPFRSQLEAALEINFFFWKFVITFTYQYARPMPTCRNEEDWCDFLYCSARPRSIWLTCELQFWTWFKYDKYVSVGIKEPKCIASDFNSDSNLDPLPLQLEWTPPTGKLQACYKQSYGNGVGELLNTCPQGYEKQGLLCYPKCGPGYYGVLFVCWQYCPSGYEDWGALCVKHVHIYGKGCCCTIFGCCGGCPSGYANDPCTCRKDAHIFFKHTYTRGAGIIPGCRSDQYQYLALCYPQCRQGFYGVGPVCWQDCATGPFKVHCGFFCTLTQSDCDWIIANAVGAVKTAAMAIGSSFTIFGVVAGVQAFRFANDAFAYTTCLMTFVPLPVITTTTSTTTTTQPKPVTFLENIQLLTYSDISFDTIVDPRSLKNTKQYKRVTNIFECMTENCMQDLYCLAVSYRNGVCNVTTQAINTVKSANNVQSSANPLQNTEIRVEIAVNALSNVDIIDATSYASCYMNCYNNENCIGISYYNGLTVSNCYIINTNVFTTNIQKNVTSVFKIPNDVEYGRGVHIIAPELATRSYRTLIECYAECRATSSCTAALFISATNTCRLVSGTNYITTKLKTSESMFKTTAFSSQYLVLKSNIQYNVIQYKSGIQYLPTQSQIVFIINSNSATECVPVCMRIFNCDAFTYSFGSCVLFKKSDNQSSIINQYFNSYEIINKVVLRYSCPSGWKLNNGRCYALYSTGSVLSETEAINYCAAQQAGGRLAMIRDTSDKMLLQSYFNRAGPTIRLSGKQKSIKNFVWPFDNSPIPLDEIPSGLWCPGSPNNQNNTVQVVYGCVALYWLSATSACLEEILCSAKVYSFCEFNATVII